MREETYHHPDPLTLTGVTRGCSGLAGLRARLDAGRGQRERRGGCESGGEAGTYLGNLCFSFLRLCLVGGTHTRHWAISSYWALVSIMLGQSLGGGGTSHTKKTPWAREAWVPGDQGWAHRGTARGPPTSWRVPQPSTFPRTPATAAGAGFRPGLPGPRFLRSRSGPSRRQPPPCQLRASQSGGSDPGGGGA